MTEYTLHQGDCLEILPTLEANSVDAVVTDPPYGLGFMGKDWDHGVPGEHFWREALRVAKPGAHLLAFGGTRTFHRLAVAIENAGWEIRDTVMWVYGSGFPKSLDVSKAIDKAAGAEREVTGVTYRPEGRAFAEGGSGFAKGETILRDKAATAAAAAWQGWGTALKPAWEPIIVARKPLAGTVAANVLEHGTGGLNIDACRVEGAPPSVPQPTLGARERVTYGFGTGHGRNGEMSAATGRWPANLIHDGSEEVVGLFPRAAGASAPVRGSEQSTTGQNGILGHFNRVPGPFHCDSGSAARFFYCAKASKADRDAGCEGLPESRPHPSGNGFGETTMWNGENGDEAWKAKNPNLPRRNHHPTVKPTDLMRYLCRLVTPPNGVVLDPFMGSGSTGKAAMCERLRFIGVELSAEYVEIAKRRIDAAAAAMMLGLQEAGLMTADQAVDLIDMSFVQTTWVDTVGLGVVQPHHVTSARAGGS